MVLASLLSIEHGVTIGASEKVSQAKGSAAPNECIGRRAESSNERRRHRQNENGLRRSARLARSRERAAEVREAETVEQRHYRLSWGQQVLVTLSPHSFHVNIHY